MRSGVFSKAQRPPANPFHRLERVSISLIVSSEHPLDGRLQRWNLAVNNLPNRGKVDIEIIMNRNISKGSDAAPINFGLARLRARG